MADNTTFIAGRLTADPKLRFTPSGEAVVEFTVACNERKYDRATSTWVDGETMYMPVEAWKALAEGAAESLRQGQPVLVSGRLKSDTWEKDGQKRSKVKLVANEIGASVRFSKGGSSGMVSAGAESAW